jgi:hypothetical protein
MTTYLLNRILPILLCITATSVIAKDRAPDDQQQAYRLEYIEREPGTDEFETSMLVTERYIRIDQPGEAEGFIIYDDKEKTVYSISHHDESVLVIKQHKFKPADSPVKHEVEYLKLLDAPEIDGHPIFNYRLYVKGDEDMTCAELQLAEKLLPEVTKMLKNYQMIVSGQQVKLTDNKISEMQTPCYFIDQIYNSGDYYERGLPIQEWHSNDSSRILTSYKKVTVNGNQFKIPEEYRRFSIDKDTKISID